MNKNFRQLRGEDLQGLNVEELQHLERSLEIGLGRVIEKKVFNCIFRNAHYIVCLMNLFTQI